MGLAMKSRNIPCNVEMGPILIDKGWPIESIGSRLRDHTRTFHSGVPARTTSSRTPTLQGIPSPPGLEI